MVMEIDIGDLQAIMFETDFVDFAAMAMESDIGDLSDIANVNF